MERRSLTRSSTWLVLGFWAYAALLCPGSAWADQAQYFYDELGRLIRVIDGQNNVATYHYDAVGNLLEITRGTTTTLQPTLNAIFPDFGRQGTTMTVTMTGTNLLGATVTTDRVGIVVSKIRTTETTIAAQFQIAPSVPLGLATVTANNGMGDASIPLAINSAPSSAVISPSVITVRSGGGTTAVGISLSTNDGLPAVVTLATDNPALATVAPSQVVVSPGGSETVTITGGSAGGTVLRATTSSTVGASVYVDQAFSGPAFNASLGVSVVITPAPVPPPTQTFTPILAPLTSVVIDGGPPPPAAPQTVSPLLAPSVSVINP